MLRKHCITIIRAVIIRARNRILLDGMIEQTDSFRNAYGPRHRRSAIGLELPSNEHGGSDIHATHNPCTSTDIPPA